MTCSPYFPASSTAVLSRHTNRGAREPRFRLLETVRAFGQEQLAAHGEEVRMQSAHAAYFSTWPRVMSLDLERHGQAANDAGPFWRRSSQISGRLWPGSRRRKTGHRCADWRLLFRTTGYFLAIGPKGVHWLARAISSAESLVRSADSGPNGNDAYHESEIMTVLRRFCRRH